MRLGDTVTVVTGAGGNTGGTIARRLGQEGAKVVVNGHRNMDAAERTAADIVAGGGEAIVVQADITRQDEARRLIDAAVEQWGKIDSLVCNVGGMVGEPLLEMREEIWDAPFKTSARGTFYCCQAAARHMIPAKHGRIVTIASLSYTGSIGYPNYAASKGALVSLTRSLALELGEHGITINCIVPGFIKSPTLAIPPEAMAPLLAQVPLGTMVEAIDIANCALFLVSDEARFITGELIHVSGGMRAVTPTVRAPSNVTTARPAD